MSFTRRFPPPCTLDEHNDDCFIVRDHNGQALAFVYCEDEPGRRSTGKLLTRDEARRIAANIAKAACSSAEELVGWRWKTDNMDNVGAGTYHGRNSDSPFQVPALRRALSGRQSRSRTRDH